MKIYEQQKEWAIKTAVAVIAMIVFYAGIVQPVFQDVINMRQSVVDAQQRADLYTSLQNLIKGMDEKEEALASLTERSQLLGKISDIAAKTQVHISTLAPRTEPNGNYIRLRMEMEGRGSFFSLLKFLQGIERLKTAIRVREVSTLLSANAMAPEDQNTLQLILGFETFLKQHKKANK